jgi:hypothetical protein
LTCLGRVSIGKRTSFVKIWEIIWGKQEERHILVLFESSFERLRCCFAICCITLLPKELPGIGIMVVFRETTSPSPISMIQEEKR